MASNNTSSMSNTNKGNMRWKEATNGMNNKIQESKNKFSRMSSFKKLWILFLFILIVVILIYWGKSISYSSSWKSKFEPVILKCPVNAYDSGLSAKTIVLPNSTQGLAFTYSFWIYISDWNYRFGEFKNILFKGKPGGDEFSPGIWLYPNTNALHARISTLADPNEGCDIQNIPLQKWVHVVYMLNTRVVDIYINGKLERSCVLKGVPKINTEPLRICQDGGFYGQMSRLQYFSNTITPNRIKQLYRAGPFGSTKYKIQFFKDGKFATDES
jgi:hypothetical protein